MMSNSILPSIFNFSYYGYFVNYTKPEIVTNVHNVINNTDNSDTFNFDKLKFDTLEDIGDFKKYINITEDEDYEHHESNETSEHNKNNEHHEGDQHIVGDEGDQHIEGDEGEQHIEGDEGDQHIEGDETEEHHEGDEGEEQHEGDETEEHHEGDETEEQHEGDETEKHHEGDEGEEHHEGDEIDEHHKGDEIEEQHEGDETEEHHEGDEGEEHHKGDEGEEQHEGDEIEEHNDGYEGDEQHEGDDLEVTEHYDENDFEVIEEEINATGKYNNHFEYQEYNLLNYDFDNVIYTDDTSVDDKHDLRIFMKTNTEYIVLEYFYHENVQTELNHLYMYTYKLHNMASLYELEFYFRKCYDNSISDDFKVVYSQKEKELKELEDTFEIHIQTELNKINSSMLFGLHNQNKFIYLHKQNIFEEKSLIDIVHGIVKEDNDFVSIWYHKNNILNQNEEYIEISKKKLSEIKNRDVLLINFDIEHIYYPSEKMYVDNREFVKEYYQKLNELS